MKMSKSHSQQGEAEAEDEIHYQKIRSKWSAEYERCGDQLVLSYFVLSLLSTRTRKRLLMRLSKQKHKNRITNPIQENPESDLRKQNSCPAWFLICASFSEKLCHARSLSHLTANTERAFSEFSWKLAVEKIGTLLVNGSQKARSYLYRRDGTGLAWVFVYVESIV